MNLVILLLNRKNLDKEDKVGVTLMDLSKAFNTKIQFSKL